MQSKDCGKGFAVDRERCEFSALPALSRSSAQFCDPFGLDLETTVNSSRRPAKKPAANRWGCCILGWRTGSKICLPPVYEPYAVGSGSVHSRANPNGVRSAVMPGFRWTGSITKSIRTWPGKWSYFGGVSSTTSCMSSTVTSVSVLMRRLAGQFLCIGTAHLRRLPPNNVQTESRRSPNNWPCRGSL
jgi:hypothetical protein